MNKNNKDKTRITITFEIDNDYLLDEAIRLLLNRLAVHCDKLVDKVKHIIGKMEEASGEIKEGGVVDAIEETLISTLKKWVEEWEDVGEL